MADPHLEDMKVADLFSLRKIMNYIVAERTPYTSVQTPAYATFNQASSFAILEVSKDQHLRQYLLTKNYLFDVAAKHQKQHAVVTSPTFQDKSLIRIFR